MDKISGNRMTTILDDTRTENCCVHGDYEVEIYAVSPLCPGCEDEELTDQLKRSIDKRKAMDKHILTKCKIFSNAGMTLSDLEKEIESLAGISTSPLQIHFSASYGGGERSPDWTVIVLYTVEE